MAENQHNEHPDCDGTIGDSETTRASESSEQSLCVVADTNPDLALAFITKTIKENPEVASDLYVMMCKFIAFKAKGIRLLRESGFTRVDVAGPEELCAYLQEDHLDWLELGLSEYAELERLDSDREYIEALAPDIECVATIIDKCRPGQVQKTLGWTKFLYFDLSRNMVMDDVKRGVPTKKMNGFFKIPFSFPSMVRVQWLMTLGPMKEKETTLLLSCSRTSFQTGLPVTILVITQWAE